MGRVEEEVKIFGGESGEGFVGAAVIYDGDILEVVYTERRGGGAVDRDGEVLLWELCGDFAEDIGAFLLGEAGGPEDANLPCRWQGMRGLDLSGDGLVVDAEK